jgi:hypothetical protein
MKYGQGQEAPELLQQVQQVGLLPNLVTFVWVLNACANMIVVEEGRSVHQQIIQSGLESDVFVGVAWLMYAKCGCIEDGWRVFEQDAILRCGHSECHTWRICHTWPR